jgi:hypothetical protein
MRPLVYVAGPYTLGDTVANFQNAVDWGERLEACGVDVHVPHTTISWAMYRPAPVARWYQRDNAILRRCDAVFRFNGPSIGADKEVELAGILGIPVFFNVPSLNSWARLWRMEHDDVA